MSMLDAQQKIIEQQREMVEKQMRLAILIGEAEANGNWSPNADELWVAYNDAGRKALEGVEKLLHKLEAKIG